MTYLDDDGVNLDGVDSLRAMQQSRFNIDAASRSYD
jgi:hypothetical protein